VHDDPWREVLRPVGDGFGELVETHPDRRHAAIRISGWSMTASMTHLPLVAARSGSRSGRAARARHSTPRTSCSRSTARPPRRRDRHRGAVPADRPAECPGGHGTVAGGDGLPAPGLASPGPRSPLVGRHGRPQRTTGLTPRRAEPISRDTPRRPRPVRRYSKRQQHCRRATGHPVDTCGGPVAARARSSRPEAW
jgi:hypothetical protein